MSNTNVNINSANADGCGCTGCAVGLSFWLFSPLILAAIGAVFWSIVGVLAALVVFFVFTLIAALITERRNTK